MAIFGSTVEFQHSEFTDEDLSEVRAELSKAFSALDKALKLAMATPNQNLKPLKKKLASARNNVLILLNNLEHRF